jgi:hypothetical protein
MSWKKEKPLTLKRQEEFIAGCAICGPNPVELTLDRIMAVGLGAVTVTKDEEIIWSDDDPSVTLQGFEDKACEDPDHDWRVAFYAPLYDSIYQRQDKGKWVLIKKGMGFA